jgi:deoxyribose-phosphate aldolase
MRINATSVTRRTNEIWSRSLKNETQEAYLRLSARCIDLTTLEGADTEGRVGRLVRKAVKPDEGVEPVAAVCVYADRVSIAREALTTAGGGVWLACVAGEFPSGRSAPEEKARAAEMARAWGADEIDMVIDRAAFLSGDTEKVYQEILQVCQAAGGGEHVKVIVEAHELGDLSAVRDACSIAIEAGAGWIKTSTGKLATGATKENIMVMLELARDEEIRTGRKIGVKAAGGVKTAKDAVRYTMLASEILGEDAVGPDRWRIGASSLLDDICLQLRHSRDKRYGNMAGKRLIQRLIAPNFTPNHA